jgi:tRNA(Arg) A34 adenosine deaminase TadA
VVSVAQLFEEPKLNHHPKWRLGVRRSESEALLREFFSTHRGIPPA